jgi:hypothetical protein
MVYAKLEVRDYKLHMTFWIILGTAIGGTSCRENVNDVHKAYSMQLVDGCPRMAGSQPFFDITRSFFISTEVAS